MRRSIQQREREGEQLKPCGVQEVEECSGLYVTVASTRLN